MEGISYKNPGGCLFFFSFLFQHLTCKGWSDSVMRMLQSSRSGREWILDRERERVNVNDECTAHSGRYHPLHIQPLWVSIRCFALPFVCVCVVCPSVRLSVCVCVSVSVCLSEHVCLPVCARICMQGKTQSVSEKQRYVGEQLNSDWFPSTEHQMYSLRRMGLCDGGGVIMLMSYL